MADYFIKMDFEGLEEYQSNLLKANLEFDTFVKSYLNELANRIMAKAVARTPVDTGTLRRNYKVSKVEEKGEVLEITVYNDAKQDGMGQSYASYVEQGHYTRNRKTYVEGRWMLTTSTDEVKKDMQKIWDSKFSNWAKQKGL